MRYSSVLDLEVVYNIIILFVPILYWSLWFYVETFAVLSIEKIY